MNKVPITAVVITYNEEENLAECLESVVWADEIIVAACDMPFINSDLLDLLFLLGRNDVEGLEVVLDIHAEAVDEILYARNLDPAEGDLAVLTGPDGEDTPAGREVAVGAALGLEKFRYQQPLAEGQKIQRLQAEPQREYWIWALAAMLVLMAMEILLAQKFGHYTTADSSKR